MSALISAMSASTRLMSPSCWRMLRASAISLFLSRLLSVSSRLSTFASAPSMRSTSLDTLVERLRTPWITSSTFPPSESTLPLTSSTVNLLEVSSRVLG